VAEVGLAGRWARVLADQYCQLHVPTQGGRADSCGESVPLFAAWSATWPGYLPALHRADRGAG